MALFCSSLVFVNTSYREAIFIFLEYHGMKHLVCAAALIQSISCTNSLISSCPRSFSQIKESWITSFARSFVVMFCSESGCVKTDKTLSLCNVESNALSSTRYAFVVINFSCFFVNSCTRKTKFVRCICLSSFLYASAVQPFRPRGPHKI